MSKPRIEPRVLKGFRDYLPQLAIPRTQMIRTLQEVFAAFGFSPIDTPALEYTEILLGKGSDETDKQLFRFSDQGGRDVAMRFDLTVPLARFVAMHINELGVPFRRYHIAPVWRAEKPQRGRYREFIQCDFDIIGTRSTIADAEIVSLIHSALDTLKIGHRIRLNNRLVLNGLLSGLGREGSSAPVLRAIDKLEKLGEEVVRQELRTEAGLSDGDIDRVFSFLKLSSAQLSNRDLLAELKGFFGANEIAATGLQELESVLTVAADSGLGDEVVTIDLSIARGLDYYTGSVFETTLTDLPEIGSICSGGRYNDLAGLYTKQELPGVGASIGLDRILAALEELKRTTNKSTTASVFVALLDEGTAGTCLKIANQLRQSGIATELALDYARLGNQLKYASKKGVEFVVIAGRGELDSGVCSVKNIIAGEQEDGVPIASLSEYLRNRIQSS
ncbi:MAG: histidine--tRNA ligase [Bdellovibrionota bacterium]